MNTVTQRNDTVFNHQIYITFCEAVIVCLFNNLGICEYDYKLNIKKQ